MGSPLPHASPLHPETGVEGLVEAAEMLSLECRVFASIEHLGHGLASPLVGEVRTAVFPSSRARQGEGSIVSPPLTPSEVPLQEIRVGLPVAFFADANEVSAVDEPPSPYLLQSSIVDDVVRYEHLLAPADTTRSWRWPRSRPAHSSHARRSTTVPST